MRQLELFREIVVDNFAGGGGASTGIEMATGLSVDIAINHDSAAIEMHKLNHPDTEHYCESVWNVDPKKAVRGRKVGLCWLSPDCTHHSKAKGGRPVEKEIRGLAWIAVRWAIAVKPRVIILENVEEFKDWGPLNEYGKPNKEFKGQTFHSFVKALESLGYQVEFKELIACDYGAPTTRKRFFMIARCDGKPIIWPNATHAAPDSLEVQEKCKLPWEAASGIVDWSINVPSIFERRRPLVNKTLKRIQKGLEKFVIQENQPYIVDTENFPNLVCLYKERGLLVDLPLHNITPGTNKNLLYAWITKYYGQGSGQSLNEPLHTITTKDRFALTTVLTNGQRVIDIGLRMLKPHELYKAQGFPSKYKFSEYTGGRKIPQYEQVRRVGNSVPPPFAEALVRANLPELCVKQTRYSVANS